MNVLHLLELFVRIGALMKLIQRWFRKFVLFGCSCFAVGALQADQKIELVDGDRIAFLGGTIFERDRLYGEIETALTEHFRGRRLIFRNIGWDGDTVFGDARAGGRRGAIFGDAAEGFEKMLQHVKRVNPTVVFVSYGATEAHAGIEGLEAFESGFELVLDKIRAPRRKVVLLTPLRVLGEGVPQRLLASSQVDQLNLNLKHYRDAIVRIGDERRFPVVDLFNAPDLLQAEDRINGLHLSQAGYRELGDYLVRSACGASASTGGRGAEKRAALGDLIRRKNELFYNFWRPRNDAFVFGERKSEQVPVQLELPQFETLIREMESSIHQLSN